MNSLNIKLLQYRAYQASQIALRVLPFVAFGVLLLSIADPSFAAAECKDSDGKVVDLTKDVSGVIWAQGCELMPLYVKINAFVSGIFLKIAGIVAVVVGIGMGMAKSSIQPAGMGIVFGVVMLTLPGIVKNFFGAVI